MKKTYNKPEISFEDFGMSSNFASTCNTKIENFQQGTCGVQYFGQATIFGADNQGCDYSYDDGSFGICYYIPTGDSNVFVS